MKIIRNILFPVLGLVIVLSGCSSSKNITSASSYLPRDLVAISQAVEPLSAKNGKKVLEGAVSLYTPWQEVMLDGKISMAGLPVDPSVKVYMQRGKSILISIRASIFGEVARIEIADGEMIMANRMKKVYVKESLDKVISKVDMTLEDVQDIFLGRMFILGQGTLNESTLSSMTVASSPSDSWIVTPLRQPSQASYGFTLFPDCRMQILFAESADGRYQAGAEYDWKERDGKKDVALTIVAGEKVYSPVFSFNAPDFNPKAFNRATFGSGWSQVPLTKFMSSF